MISNLEGARSRVRTASGLTERFPVLSSVRQGDPIAPLIYVFVVDALHEGLRNSPLYGNDAASHGYTFLRADGD